MFILDIGTIADFYQERFLAYGLTIYVHGIIICCRVNRPDVFRDIGTIADFLKRDF
jgi:hypothetical protein